MTARLCCAYLRVYQPLADLSDAERSLAEQTNVPSRSPVKGPILGLLAPDECCEVYSKIVGGETFLCPTHTRLRWLLGLVAFERSIPGGAAPLFFSTEEMSAARRELERLERDQPGVRPSIVQSVWHVPPQWFVCFDDSERRFEQSAGHPTIRYETTIEQAQQRVGRALDTVTGGIVHPVVVGVIYEMREWLNGFSPRSLMELDYASVATLFVEDDLADDHSAADVWSAIGALGEGDGKTAAEYYGKVHRRMGAARARVPLN